MKGSDIFTNKSLSAADIKGKGPVVVYIYSVETKKFDDGVKPIISFASKNGTKLAKSLVCNKTNWFAIAEQLGDDSDQWVGKPITLIATKTDYAGKRVDCIRVDDPPAKGKTGPTPASRFIEPEDNTPFLDDARDVPPPSDDDVPF